MKICQTENQKKNENIYDIFMKIDKFISRIERISSIFFRFFESPRRVFEIEQFRCIFAIEQSRRIFEIESRVSEFPIDAAETFFFFKIRKFRTFSKSKLADL